MALVCFAVSCVNFGLVWFGLSRLVEQVSIIVFMVVVLTDLHTRTRAPHTRTRTHTVLLCAFDT